jgi:hypothetical protein
VDRVDDQHIHLGDYMMFDIVHRVGYEHLDDLNDVYIDKILSDAKICDGEQPFFS